MPVSSPRPLRALVWTAALLLLGAVPLGVQAQAPSPGGTAVLLPVPDPCDPLLGDADGDGWADRCECGDVNQDGFVNTTDARLIQRCAVGEIPCHPLCDVTGDGRCDTRDARMIQRVAVQALPKDALVCDLRVRCCDPALEPGVNGNPLCFEGATCCASGRWSCNQANGQPSCHPGRVCEKPCDPVPCDLFCPYGYQEDLQGCPVCACLEPPQCCDPTEMPGVGGHPLCFEGATCCRDGAWACNQGNGTPSCRPGPVCDPTRCCDPAQAPGVGGNPICFEGATCCADGRWACNRGDGSPSCDVVGRPCPDKCPPVFCELFCPFGFRVDERGCEICECRDQPPCCDPTLEPGQGSNPLCIEGHTCCADGRWACNRGDGTPACREPGDVCPVDRCRTSADCARTEFCAKPQGACEGLGVCRPRPDACTEEFAPVCGCDGQTYSNACHAHGAGVSVAHDGACRPKPCDTDLDCGPGGFCEVPACGVLDVSPAGFCVDKPELCPLHYLPVCGCDGRTYGNDCERLRAGVWKAHDGPCEQFCGGIAGFPCPNPDQFCRFRNGTCQVADNAGVCVDVPQACPRVYAPVCGCDGKTYGNECEAMAARAQVDHDGPCRTPCSGNADCASGQICFPPTRTCQPPCEILCLVPDPVCASDGRTYECGQADAHCHGAEVVHPGPCQ